MKITKFIHACLLVELDGRVALFDPGNYSQAALNVDSLTKLDDIFITHEHGDHFSLPLIQTLVQKFPAVRITTTKSVVNKLAGQRLRATNQPSKDVTFFTSPHESIAPLIPTPPEQIGFHYLGKFSHPGDSHSFEETKAILAMPVSAPWGSSAQAIKVALELKPRYILPIHDWHWHDEARALMYTRFEQIFADNNIQFFSLKTGQPVEIDE